MQSHRYQIGQTVQFVKSARNGGLGRMPDGGFKVVKQLPNYEGNNQYRVKSTADGHERVVIESDIVQG